MKVDQSKARAIFIAAVENHTPEEWEAFLDDECGENSDLRKRVEALLKAHQGEDSYLDRGDVAVTAAMHESTEKIGTQIGPYKLLQQVGEGGMGVVYLAEQTEPVKRRVALKIIKPGMDSRQVIARFEAERQAVAMMDHPNIAKVLDAGTTESGRPYFVMELVNGVPLTEYCDEEHLSPKERLELFLPVCQAIHHAHQKGIIHRDLKPSNILVALYDHEPVPKVIDFGVAKATSQSLTEKTLFTQFGQVVGTLEYMSPEQAHRNQLDIDTRSDIYALGVVLYELLTGTTPFDKQRLRSAAFDEMLRIIREEEPPRPSTRLSSIETLPSVAANRKTEPRKLRTLVRGELDWIVMKALDKDRARRYDTATNFAGDIERFLNHQAVLACPPSIAYRCKKSLRRNRAALATASTIVLALLLGLAGTARQAALAQQAEERARAEGLVKSLPSMNVANIPTTITSDLLDLRHWADPLLKDEIAKAADGSATKLHLSLALLPIDERQIEYLGGQLPISTLDQFLVVRDALEFHKDMIADSLWLLVQDEDQDDSRRFQAAAALAKYDPRNERWNQISNATDASMVARHAVELPVDEIPPIPGGVGIAGSGRVNAKQALGTTPTTLVPSPVTTK